MIAHIPKHCFRSMFTPLLMKRVAGLGMEENKFVAGWTAFEDRLRGRKLLLRGLAQTTTRAQLRGPQCEDISTWLCNPLERVSVGRSLERFGPVELCEIDQSCGPVLGWHVFRRAGGTSGTGLFRHRTDRATGSFSRMGAVALAAWSAAAFAVETDCEDSGVPPPSATLRRSGR